MLLRSTSLACMLVATACRIDFDPIAAAPVDASADATSDGLVDACAGRLFCDGFDDPALAAWAGTIVTGGSTIDRVATPALRGAALRASGADGSRDAAIYADAFPAGTVEHWLRIFYFVPTGAALSIEPLAIETPTRSGQLVLAIYDGGADIHAHGIAGNFLRDGLAELPRDTWNCVELHVTIGTPGAVELYVDGALVVAEPVADLRPPAGETLARATVGIASKPAAGAQTIFVDEVIADDERIGCTLP